MKSRQHEFIIDIAAPPEEIWQALTEPGGIQKWFAPLAAVEPGPGGKITLSWGEAAKARGRFTVGRKAGAWDGPKAPR